jgi:hypothetical protein
MLVKWNGKNVWSIGKGMADGAVVQLVPGPNELEKADWEAIKDHPVVKARMEKDVIDMTRGKVKMLEVVVAKVETGSSDDNSGSDDNNEGGSTLSSLNATDAVKLIKETFNVELLRKWEEDETRKKPMAAIKAQFEAIEKSREEDEAGDDAAVVE